MSRFVSNVLKLFSATLLGQVLGVLATPLLSRLYTPADFGTYQLFFSIVPLVAVICLSYEPAVILPEKHEDAANLFALTLIIIVAIAAVTAIFFFIFATALEEVLGIPDSAIFILLLPVAILANTVGSVSGTWLIRKEQFNTVAQSNLASSVVGKSVSIGSGVISPTPYGLVSGTIMNDVTIIIVSIRKVFSDAHYLKTVSWERIKNLAVRYKRFPIFNTSASFANSATLQAIPFLLAIYFTQTIVGFYAMAYMVIILPIKLMSNCVTSVFYQKTSSQKNVNGDVAATVEAVHVRLVYIGMFISLVLMIIGPELFMLILGDQWKTAGVYASILAPCYFFAFIMYPLGTMFNVYEKQATNLWFNVLILGSNITALVISGILQNPLLGILLLSIIGILSNGYMDMYLLKIGGASRRKAVIDIAKYFVFGVVVCLPLIAAKYLAYPDLDLLVIAAVLTAVYYAVVIWRDAQLKAAIRRIFRDRIF